MFARRCQTGILHAGGDAADLNYRHRTQRSPCVHEPLTTGTNVGPIPFAEEQAR